MLRVSHRKRDQGPRPDPLQRVRLQNHVQEEDEETYPLLRNVTSSQAFLSDLSALISYRMVCVRPNRVSVPVKVGGVHGVWVETSDY